MAIRIDTPIQFLKGVGPHLGGLLRQRGVRTVGELLHWYPRAYEDRRAARNISTLKEGEIVSLKAHVVSVKSFNMGKSHRKIYDVSLADGTGVVHCKYFRSPYKGYFERFRPQQMVRVAGKVLFYHGRIEFHHPDIQDVIEESENLDALIPLYTETEGLSPTKIRKLIGLAIDQLIDNPEAAREDYARKIGKDVPLEEIQPIERLPEWILKKYQLPRLETALKGIHQPPTGAGPDYVKLESKMHHRVIFEEFFWLELFLAMRKDGVKREKSTPLPADTSEIEKVKASLPFQLTAGQLTSLKEIVGDLTLAHPMHRLVQGDVGCGKTLVALLASVHIIKNGLQAAFMVPTEILAEQHFHSAERVLQKFGVRIAMLTGAVKGLERKELLHKLQQGEIDLCIGTHALIQEDVGFKQLGLVIVDEQHRFGVLQRGQLKEKGICPHFLVMTATPIPRTLAMTVYGDLEVSVIRDMPPGRQKIVTRVTYESKRDKVIGFLQEQVKAGRQAYIIYPLVEESEKIDLKDAHTAFAQLCETLPEVRFGLLHGKMKAEEKDAVMDSFRKHQLDVLVSTTVIEVGVDVPNANLMIIENAERFGLSQLHQLRGRVGRGMHKSYCVLIMGYAVSEESRARAQIMERTSDGFEIAEADLELRGPGEFLGSRQSGLPGFRMANLIRDVEILKMARDAAFELIAKDPNLRLSENRYIHDEMLNQHGVTSLAGIG